MSATLRADLAAIDRCDREIALCDATPVDTTERAYLVAMGRNDWEAERRLIQEEILIRAEFALARTEAANIKAAA